MDEASNPERLTYHLVKIAGRPLEKKTYTKQHVTNQHLKLKD